MTTIKNFFMAAALAVATLAPAAASGAMPLSAPTQSVDQKSDVTNARIVCGYYSCHREYRPRYYRPRVYVSPSIVIRPAPRVIVRSGYRPHVRWCLNRYRSYSPESNTYVGFDGRYHACVSPYRG